MSAFPSPPFMALLSPAMDLAEWKERADALRSGAWPLDINEVDPRTDYPLLHAFVSAHSRTRRIVGEQDNDEAQEVVKALLELGANPAALVDNETALEWCLSRRDWKMAHVLEQALPCAVYTLAQEKLLTCVEDGLFDRPDNDITTLLDQIHASFGTLNPDVRGVPLQWALVNSYFTNYGFRLSRFKSISKVVYACAQYGERDAVGLWAVAGWSAVMREYYATDDGCHERSVWEGLAMVNNACIGALSGGQCGESAAWKRLVYHIENALAAGCPLDKSGQLQWAKTCIGAAACVDHMSRPVPTPKTGKLPPESPYKAKLAALGWKLLAQGMERTISLEPTIEPAALSKLFSKGEPADPYSRDGCFAVEEGFMLHRPSDISLWETLAPMSYARAGSDELRPVGALDLANEVPPPRAHVAMKMLAGRDDELGRAARVASLDEQLPIVETVARPRM